MQYFLLSYLLLSLIVKIKLVHLKTNTGKILFNLLFQSRPPSNCSINSFVNSYIFSSKEIPSSSSASVLLNLVSHKPGLVAFNRVKQINFRFVFIPKSIFHQTIMLQSSDNDTRVCFVFFCNGFYIFICNLKRQLILKTFRQ